MAFNDFPFDSQLIGKESSDTRRFCGHAEVQALVKALEP